MKTLYILPLLYFLGQNLTAQEIKWELVFEHDKEGKTINGSKESLIEAVRNGNEVRLGWQMGEGDNVVEHFAEVQFLTIMNGEVFGQIQPILSQKPLFEANEITFRDKLKWSFIASTTGLNSTIFYFYADGNALKLPNEGKSRWGNKWFVEK